MSVGTYLREAREAAGFSLEKISESTRIPQAVIRDLERSVFASSGGNAYARGHIRTISKLLHADTDALMLAFEEATSESDRLMIDLLEESSATHRRPIKNFSRSPKFVAVVAAIIVGIAIIIPSGLVLAKKFTHKSSIATLASASQGQSSAPSKSSSMKSNSQTPVLPSGSVSTDRGVIVTASAGTSWLAVRDLAGAQLFAGKLSNGTSQSFDPTYGLFMTIGNAGAVKVTVNGKDQGAIGKSGEVKTLTFAAPQTNG